MAAKRKSEGASDSKSKKAKPFSKPKPEEPSALPEPLEAADNEAPATDAPAEKTPKREKKEKKDKKESASKKRKADDIELTNGDDNEATDAKVKKEEGAADVKAPKAKKGKKGKKAVAEGDEAAAEESAEGAEVAEGGKKEKANRFIVFVGNLPYTANAATIRQHFASVKPEGVRCLTKDGKENTCRGFAFIEFTHPTNMRTCLDKLHHSIFNDGLSPARKINVELTVGGGGNKSTNRKEKIKARNAELEVNRAKRIQKEAEQKRAAAGGEPAKPSDDGGMHPSRRAMLP